MKLTRKDLEDMHNQKKISDRAYNLLKPVVKGQPTLLDYDIKNIQMISDRLFTTEEEPQDLKKLTYIQ